MTVDRIDAVAVKAVKAMDSYQSLATDTAFAPVASQLKTRVNAFNLAYMITHPKFMLGAKDASRDNGFLMVFSLADAYARYIEFDQQVGEAGLKLQKLMQHYSRRLTQKSMAIETGDIESLLTDIKDKITQDELDLMPGVEAAIDILKKTHADFAQAQQKSDGYRENHPATASSMKQDLLNFINHKFLPYLSFRADTDGNDFKALYDEIAGSIKAANTQAKLRRKQITALNKAKKEAEKQGVTDGAGSSTSKPVKDEPSDPGQGKQPGTGGDVTPDQPDAEINPGSGSDSGDDSRPMV